MNINSKAKLNNGVFMPYFGLGVWQAKSGEECRNAVKWAISEGYRHIDTARFYENEEDVGFGVRESGVPRDEVFITTKLWNDDHGYENTLRAFDESLERIGLGYIDLYLIHFPVENIRLETWEAMEKIYSEGKAKAIGVSNYTIKHLEELLSKANIVPAVNQVEFHAYLYQKELLDFCNSNGIQLEAYAPLTRTKKFGDQKLIEIANKYNKTPAQILIRWVLQHGVIVIPKSSNKKRIHENAQVFDFEITKEDMDLLDTFNEDYRCCWDPSDTS